jgi:hypothetical protein
VVPLKMGCSQPLVADIAPSAARAALCKTTLPEGTIPNLSPFPRGTHRGRPCLPLPRASNSKNYRRYEDSLTLDSSGTMSRAIFSAPRSTVSGDFTPTLFSVSSLCNSSIPATG